MLPMLLLRDLLVGLGGGIALVVRPDLRLRSRGPGKRLTYVQFTAVGVVLMWPAFAVGVTLVTGAFGVYAVVDYVRAFIVQLRPHNARSVAVEARDPDQSAGRR
jgi:hypothetical protein